MTTIRYNPDKANTTEFGHSSVHDAQDRAKCIEDCYEICGCYGIALLAVLAVGAAILTAGSNLELDLARDHCWEVCSYDDAGVGICECIFRNIFGD